MVSFLQVSRQYWMRTNAFLKDSYHLGRTILRESSGQHLLTDTWRNVVTTQARQSNQAALTVLQIQQQIGLLRYHGMMEYLRQQRTRTATNSTSMTTRASSTTSANAGVAKVAFMITSSMKSQLVEELGYDVEQIKEMTPTQASLILHHKVSPSAMEQELPVLIQQYEEQQRAEQEKLAKKSVVDDKNDVVESTDTEPASSSEPSTSIQTLEQQQEEDPVLLESSKPTTEPVVSDASLSENEALDDARAMFGNSVDDIAFGLDSQGILSPTFWYEIIEIDTKAAMKHEETLSQELIVAMYRTKDEAQMALELKEAFAQRQATAKKLETPSLVYKIRKSNPVKKGI